MQPLGKQYVEQFQKGDSVQYENKLHRVQEDHGWLFIQVSKQGKRIKLDLKKIPDLMFEYGSFQDWIFNEWYKVYPDYEMFKQFAENEKTVS